MLADSPTWTHRARLLDLKAARGLGIDVPGPVRIAADELIE